MLIVITVALIVCISTAMKEKIRLTVIKINSVGIVMMEAIYIIIIIIIMIIIILGL